MSEDKRSKKRSANFTKNEIELLCNLIVKYASIIESKKTDAVMWKEKMQAWDKLNCEFNLKNNDGPARTVATLKTKYEGIKKDLKKKVAANKQELFKTGGGAAKIIPLTPYEEIIYNIINLSVEGLPPRNDDDCTLGENICEEFSSQEIIQESETQLFNKQNEQVEMGEETIILEVNEDSFQEHTINNVEQFTIEEVPSTSQSSTRNTSMKEMIESPVSSTPQRWNPVMLKKPKSKELQVRKDGILTKLQAAEKVKILAESKKELLQLQMQYLKREMEFQEKEHNLKYTKAEEEIKNLKLDNAIKKIEKQIKEETLKKLLNSNLSCL